MSLNVILYRQAYTFSWTKRSADFFLNQMLQFKVLTFSSISPYLFLFPPPPPPLYTCFRAREYGAKNECMLAGFHLQEKSRQCKWYHSMWWLGFWRVGFESNMLTKCTHTTSWWKVVGPKAPPLQPTRTWRSIAALGFLSSKCHAWPWRAFMSQATSEKARPIKWSSKGNSTLLTIETVIRVGRRKKGEKISYLQSS